ncbi:PQQ-dependent sugar dehydrogenase [Persicitalea jodogahamensis]|uniref:Sorbosone dehydrogenase n=1 Tax=Persicitalea jodogahamensis TaxID=402147 RepID=A0A8J3GB90_9BACT|nr:PQQ-dependent sugar dehydrogenase [Persicitalea jodogahamensis]GHB85632.1 sorbosone dehydrogenase [Persicitalea jodogahamensis]
MFKKRTSLYATLLISALASVPTNQAVAQMAKDKIADNAVAEPVIKVPANFKTTIVADGLGKARHLTVTDRGDVYVRLAKPVGGGGTVFLRDTDGDGKMDEQKSFGDFGGTGIALGDGYLYTTSSTEIFRYKLNGNQEVIDPNKPERIVTGLTDKGTHASKSVVLDKSGNIYVGIGAPSNACQVKDRTKGSPGMMPCAMLDSVGGIWQFKTNQPDQILKDGVHYATGIRNMVGMDWNGQTNSLFIMQHGRDQLNTLFPDMYTDQQSAVLPAEAMYELKKGANAGWPYTYYDQIQKKKIVAPEYGGDGKKEGSSEYIDPAAAYPGHLAPNGLLFYTGSQFPEKYRNGAFIAFHGSWNRAPEPQAGYFVVFQPFKNGKPSGDWEVFADNFAGMETVMSPGSAMHRPCGLAQGPDGSLYVADDVKGTLYKISYSK